MAFILEVAIIDGGDSTIKVVHQFFGETERECETYKREHLGTCSYFKSAQDEGRTREDIEEIDDDDLPTLEDFEAA